MNDPAYKATVLALSERLVEAQSGIRVLDAVSWGDEVRDAFLAAGGEREPSVDAEYYARRPLACRPDEVRQELRGLAREVDARLGRFNGAGRILARTCEEYLAVLDMLEARGTPDFSRISAEVYGRSTDALHPGQPSLADLAVILDETLRSIDGSSFLDVSPRDISTERAVQILQARLDEAFAPLGESVQVRSSDGIVADAAAGSDYIKLRRDARFSERDLRVLEVHEGWVHVGTTLNGRKQPVCRFLEKAPPSAVITQEGLALFVEVISFSSHPARLRRVTDRIRAVHRAEQGAGFLDVFRLLRDEGRDADDAYATCARVFRGSTPRGGPFTKDLAYSKGFYLVYNFIRLAVRRGRLDRIPLLFAGKPRLEDMGDVAGLFEEGLVEVPRWLPPPFADLPALTAWMANTIFLNRLDLERVEADFSSLLA